MKADTLKLSRSGVIYFNSACSRSLGIAGWKWLAVSTGEEHMLWKISRVTISVGDGEHILRLRSSDGNTPRRACCIEFADRLADRFGDFENLYLRYVICPRDVHGEDDTVLISVDNPPNTKPAPDRDGNHAMPEQEKVEAQVEVARWIKDNGCDEVSCNGTEGFRFDGVICPLSGSDSECGRGAGEEMFFAEMWLESNGYPHDQEIPLETISNPTEPPAIDKPAAEPRTRPLPDGLPEWLRGPLSRGEQVLVTVRLPEEEAIQGWAAAAYENLVAVIFGDGYFTSRIKTFSMSYISPSAGKIKSPDECFRIAKKLCIGLSPLQISAIIDGGIPPAGHGLPDEMFE